ncbi:hypothetical protein AAK967_06500 [Atopobiaceae bacterium 24-176]
MATNPYSDGSSRTPKHAKHAAKPATSPGPGRAGTRRQSQGGRRIRPAADVAPLDVASAPVAADDVAVHDAAPRPIGVDPSETGAFSTLASGEGAVIHDRGSASEAASAARKNFRRGGSARMRQGKRPQVASRQGGGARVSRPVVIGLGVAAICVVVVLAVVVIGALNTVPTSLEGGSGDASVRVEQTQDDQGQGIEYGGFIYSVRQNADGAGYSFVRTQSTGGEPQALFQLQGTPVTVVLYNGAFLIPQNLGDSWNVISWVMGDGSVDAVLTREDGTPVEGGGTVSSAKLDGSNLVLSFDNGVTDTVALQ